MGWSNYIIIDDLKLIIETSREVDDMEDYEKDALAKMISAEDDDRSLHDDYINMENVKIGDITIGDLVSLYNAYKNTSAIVGMNSDKFLLYWFKTREINYIVKSEHNVDIQQYIDSGYIILRRC